MFDLSHTLSLEKTKALNVLRHQARVAVFKVEDKPYQLRFKRIAQEFPMSVVFHLEVDGRDVYVGLHDFPQLMIEGVVVQRADLQNIPASIATALIETALSSWLQVLENKAHTAVALKALHFKFAVPPHEERLDFVIDDAEHNLWVEGALFLDEPILLKLANRWLEAPQEVQETHRELNCVAMVTVGCQTLSLHDWESLQSGDIVLFNEAASPEAGSYHILLDNQRAFLATHENNTFTLTHGLYRPMDPQSTAASLDALMLQLDFSLGSTTLSLADLQSLKPGYTFDLPISKDGPVRILINGQEMGEGMLVNVAGKLGVRLIGIGESISGSLDGQRLGLRQAGETKPIFSSGLEAFTAEDDIHLPNVYDEGEDPEHTSTPDIDKSEAEQPTQPLVQRAKHHHAHADEDDDEDEDFDDEDFDFHDDEEEDDHS